MSRQIATLLLRSALTRRHAGSTAQRLSNRAVIQATIATLRS